MDSSGVGPGNGAEFFASVVAHVACRLAALLLREEGKVAAFVQQVAGEGELGRVHAEDAAWIPGRKVGWGISAISTGKPIPARKAAMVERVRSDKLTR
jgi:hypothetical protein